MTVLLDESQEQNELMNIVKIVLGKKQAALASRQCNQESNIEKKIPRTSRNRIILKSNNCVIYRCR